MRTGPPAGHRLPAAPLLPAHAGISPRVCDAQATRWRALRAHAGMSPPRRAVQSRARGAPAHAGRSPRRARRAYSSRCGPCACGGWVAGWDHPSRRGAGAPRKRGMSPWSTTCPRWLCCALAHAGMSSGNGARRCRRGRAFRAHGSSESLESTDFARAPRLCGDRLNLCARGDLNPYVRGHQNLNLARLPISPLALDGTTVQTLPGLTVIAKQLWRVSYWPVTRPGTITIW